jgi:hypothetical protein
MHLVISGIKLFRKGRPREMFKDTRRANDRTGTIMAHITKSSCYFTLHRIIIDNKVRWSWCITGN